MAISDRVTSNGVPNTVVVDRKDSGPCGVSITSGVAITPPSVDVPTAREAG